MVCSSDQNVPVEQARRGKSHQLEEFHFYMWWKLLTCQRFLFCSSSVVFTTRIWELPVLFCWGTIKLWMVGTSAVQWWVHPTGAAFNVGTHARQMLTTHLHLHPLTYTHIPTTNALTHLIQFTCIHTPTFSAIPAHTYVLISTYPSVVHLHSIQCTYMCTHDIHTTRIHLLAHTQHCVCMYQLHIILYL